MNTKYYVEDPPREKYQSIEKTPQDYYPKFDEKAKHLSNLLEKNQKAFNEKSESKTSKRKSKKNHIKTDSTAMAQIQEEL